MRLTGRPASIAARRISESPFRAASNMRCANATRILAKSNSCQVKLDRYELVSGGKVLGSGLGVVACKYMLMNGLNVLLDFMLPL